jgi:GAF domain-containing protein
VTGSNPDRSTSQAVGSAGQPLAAGLARQMTELARSMQAERDPHALMLRIVAAAVADIPNARYAGLTLTSGHGLHTEAASDPLVERVDAVQYEARQGPCVQSSWSAETVRADDLMTDERWPTFSKRAAELGIRSMLSIQLFVESSNMGALNLYAGTPYAFNADDENVGMMLAAHAAVAMAARRKEANLQIALDSRDTIGQAKGILMERYKVSSQQAFDMLIYVSQRSHRKLREIAGELAETGQLPVD